MEQREARCAMDQYVGAERNLSQRADPILSQG
jgi:hypothetical protein